MAQKNARKRTFGELEAHRNRETGAVTGWRARYTGRDLKRHSRSFGDKMAAEAWLNAERLLIDRDQWTPPRERERQARLEAQREITFAEWAERSITGKQLRPSTIYRYERTLRKRVLPDLGHIPLRDPTRLDVTNWYTKMRAQLAAEAKAANRKGDGRGAAFSAYQVLSAVLNDAVDHELLETSPARVKGALRYDALHEPVVLTPEQMWTLHELMPDYLAAMVPLAATTGLRHGELRALQRRHLDLEDAARAFVHVRGTAANNRVSGRYNETGEPKTKASRRDVAILACMFGSRVRRHRQGLSPMVQGGVKPSWQRCRLGGVRAPPRIPGSSRSGGGAVTRGRRRRGHDRHDDDGDPLGRPSRARRRAGRQGVGAVL